MIKKVQTFLVSQLKKGITPHEVALACAVGVTGCMFPTLGATTLLCFLAAYFLRLNHPIVQTVNYASGPVQLLMFPVFIQLGAWIFQVQAVSFNPQKIYLEFVNTPSLFFENYGWAWVQAMLAWLLCAPFLMLLVYKLVRAAFARAASRNKK